MSEDIHIPVSDPRKQWKCTECGHELTQAGRPKKCPDCNCVDGDTPPGTHIFIPKGSHWEDRPND